TSSATTAGWCWSWRAPRTACARAWPGSSNRASRWTPSSATWCCREGGGAMIGISKRVQGFTESVIREMTRVNNQYNEITPAQGMPTFPPPRELVEAAHRALDGDFHQYAITWGTPRLRQAIAAKYRRFYGLQVDPERHVTVCCGSTETMLATLLAVLNPGDEVIIFEPFYEN